MGPSKGTLQAELKPAGPEAEIAKSAAGTDSFQSFGFAISPGFQEPGNSAPQALTIVAATKQGEPQPTGTLTIIGDGELGTLGTLDVKNCKATRNNVYSCSALWNPPASMATGEHKISAFYSGDSKFAPTYAKSNIQSFATASTSTTISASTINTDSSQTITFTSVTTWTGSGSPPAGTGTISFTCSDPSATNSDTCSSLTSLPPAQAVSACITDATAQTITCTFSYNLDGNDPHYGSFGFNAVYSGDSNYAASTGTVFVDDYESQYGGSGTVTITPSQTYGAPGGSITYTVVYTALTYGSSNPVTLTGAGPTYTELTGLPISGTAPTLGQSIIAGNASGCTYSTSAGTLTCTITAAIPASLALGTYNIGAEFSGNFFDLAETGSATLNVTNATIPSTIHVTASSVAYGTGNSSTVTITDTWSGSTAPTGNLNLSDAEGYLTATIPLSGCTRTTSTEYTCTYAWTNASTVPTSPDVVTAQYPGDANFVPESGSGNLVITFASGGNPLRSTSFTISTGTQVYGTTTTQDFTFALQGPNNVTYPTGSAEIYAASPVNNQVLVNLTTLPSYCAHSTTTSGSRTYYSVTCTNVPWTTSATLPVGSYTESLAYSGDSNYASATLATSSGPSAFSVTAATPTIAITPSPATTTYGSTTVIPLTVTISGTGVSGDTAPTAVPTMTATTGTFAAVSCSSAGTTETCTVNYTPSGTAPIGNNANYITATLAAGGNYAAATGRDNLLVSQQTPTATMVSPVSTSPTTQTYGALSAFAVSGTLTWTGGSTAPTKSDISFASTAAGAFGSVTCSTGTLTYTCSATFTPTAGDAPGTYNINLSFSGDTNYASTASTQSGNYVINKATPTFGTMGFSPAATEPYSVSQAITITDSLSYTGSTKPSGAVTFTLNSVGYTATCTGSSSPLSCTAQVPAATIAALPAAPYTVTAVYTADTDYATATGTSGTFTITTDTDKVTVTPAPTSIGPGGSSVVTIAVSNTQASATSTPAGSVKLVDTTNAGLNLGTCTLSSGSCTITVPATSLVSGANTLTATYTASPANWATGTTGTGTLTLTSAPTTSVSLTPATTGSTTTGVTTATLTAAITAASNDGLWGGTVTFTNTTTGATYSGTVTGSGTTGSAAVTISLPDSGTSAGLDNYTAKYNGTANYAASAASNSVAVYWQGLLISTDLSHNFSGLISYGSPSITVEGTEDGTKLGPYGVVVYNFTTASQTVGLNFTNASSGAFSYVTNCPASLAAGKTCNYYFYYAPPTGDGCNPSTNCTKDSSNYPQGTYESGTWQITSGATLGIGDTGFDRSGPVAFPATLAGKAVLSTTSPISVTPLTYTFGPLAPGELSNTLTITVTNPGSASVGLSYTPPVTTPFQATNYCPANLAAHSNCTINVTFQNSTTGTVTDKVVITPSGGSAITVSLTGIVNTNNGLQLSTNSHSFGNVTTGSSAASFGLSITNNASTSATLSFGTSQSGTTPYNVVTSGCPSTLAPGAQCSVVVSFSPTAAGTFNDVLTVNSDVPILPDGTGSSPNYSDTVSFTGTGVSAGQFTATSVNHNWGNVTVGTTGTNYGVQLTNATSTTVTLTLGGGFTQGQYGFSLAGTNCGSTLAVNASCELIFSFSPTGAGAVTASYGVTAVNTSSNPVQLYSGGNPYSAITLVGTGQ